MFLTRAELKALTGTADRKRQAECLRANRIPFTLDVFNRPVVTRSAIEKVGNKHFLYDIGLLNKGKTMKLTITTMILIAMFPAAALATGSPSNNNGPRNGGNSASNSAAISGAASSKSEARAAARSKSKSAAEATGGNAAASGGDGGAGGQVIVSNVGNSSNGLTGRIVPDVSASSPITSTSCRNGITAGGSGNGWGGLLGFFSEDEMCEWRLLEANYRATGNHDKANAIRDGMTQQRCEKLTPRDREMFGNLCHEKPREEKPAPSVTLF